MSKEIAKLEEIFSPISLNLLNNIPTVDRDDALRFSSETSIGNAGFITPSDELVKEEDEIDAGNNESRAKYVRIGDTYYDISLIKMNNESVNKQEVTSSIRFHSQLSNRESGINANNGISVVSNKLDGETRILISAFKELMMVLGYGLRSISYSDRIDEYINNVVYTGLKTKENRDILPSVFPYNAVGNSRLDLSSYAKYTTTLNMESEEFPYAFKTSEGQNYERNIRTVNTEDGEMKISNDNTRHMPLVINFTNRDARNLTNIINKITMLQLALCYSISARNSINSTFNEKELLKVIRECYDNYLDSDLPTEESELVRYLGISQGEISQLSNEVSEKLLVRSTVDFKRFGDR